MILNPCYAFYGAVNIAENFTQPGDYFDFGEDVRKVPIHKDVAAHLSDHPSLVIFGGGGLHGKQAWVRLRQFVDAAPKTLPIVIWGMGINDHGRLDWNYNSVLPYLQQQPNVLIGLRDGFYPTYVPCASCMRPEFDEEPSLQQEVVFYAHHGFPEVTLPCPTMSNRVEGEPSAYFRRVIEFLGSAEIVVTNTYHGAYWARLLKRKLIVVAPFSNKFMGLKPQPVIVQDAALLAPLLRSGQIETLRQMVPSAATVLSDSRTANLRFFEQVTRFRRSFTADASPVSSAVERV